MGFPNTQESSSREGSFMSAAMGLPYKAWGQVVKVAKQANKIGKDDPRKIVHSLKVGLALTLVSLFYYYKPLYDGFGVNAIWAALTVVVVFEFSVGATLGKSLNRIVATLIAATLAVGAHRLATHSGRTGEPILIATFVFLAAAVVTFTRFFPALKARYDYGLTIFILTFCLVSVSGYRDAQVLTMAHMRGSTIIIGCCATIVISIIICPVWIGEDLHNLVLDNVQKLGIFLEGFGNEYFKLSEDDQPNNDKSFLQSYKSVLTSKTNEENMVNLAKWEPCHGRFRFCHPWKQYLKIASLTRDCAYKIEALNSSLHSEFQTPIEIRKKFEESCTKLSTESGKALKELSSAAKKMKTAEPAARHIINSKAAAENVKKLLKTSSWEFVRLIDSVPVGSVASLLLEVVESVERIAEAINELASVAHFKAIDPTVSPEPPHLLHRGTVLPIPCTAESKPHLITIKE